MFLFCMIPQDVIDSIHWDIDRMIENMPHEVTMFTSSFVKSKYDYEHTVDFMYGFEIGRLHRLFSYMMAEKGNGATPAELVEFAELVFKRASTIRHAILKVIPPD